MSRVILVTGGCRSGKSSYAQKLAQDLPGRHVYLATGVVTDDEMRQRILKHQKDRLAKNWQTHEESLALDTAIRKLSQAQVILVDCLTLWVNNLMYHAEQQGAELSEEQLVGHCEEVQGACRAHNGTIIFVTNEVGMGIVPDNAAARRYRDLAGRCNQLVAGFADAVTLVSCGIPILLKA